MNFTKKSSATHTCILAAFALGVCLVTPQAMAKKKKHEEPVTAASPKDIAKWDTEAKLPSLGKIKINGAAHYEQGDQFSFENTVKIAGAEFDVGCTVEVNAKSKVCLDVINRSIETGPGMTCAINGQRGSTSGFPGKPKLDLCAKFDMKGFSSKMYPKGGVKVNAEAGALGQYKKVEILSKDFH